MTNYKNLKVVVLTDGRPGHEKQSLGIVNALSSMTGVDVLVVPVEKSGFLKNVYKNLVFALGVGSYNDNRFVGADLFIGAGRHTHIPILQAQKNYGGRAVSCMTPSSILRDKFDFCFVPSHDSVQEGANIVYTLGAPNGLSNKHQHHDEVGLILIGGISSKQEWSTDEALQHVRSLTELFPNKKWKISSSPRTPKETVSSLQKFAGTIEQVDFFHYENTPKGWVEEQYHYCKDVWVTADSISMVFEALSAGCSVGLLPVLWKEESSKFQKNEDYLIENKFVTTLEQVQADLDTFRKPKSFNEALKCARLMLDSWWAINKE